MSAIATPPAFAVHRKERTAADASPSTKKAEGINARGYRFVLIDVALVSGSLTALALSVMFWSEAAGKFIPSLDTAHQVAGLTGSARWIVPVYGDTFWVMVPTLTGTSPKVTISVAGFSEPTAH